MVVSDIRKPWTESDISELKRLVQEKTPIRLIRLQLQRSEAAILGKLKKLKLDETTPNPS